MSKSFVNRKEKAKFRQGVYSDKNEVDCSTTGRRAGGWGCWLMREGSMSNPSRQGSKATRLLPGWAQRRCLVGERRGSTVRGAMKALPFTTCSLSSLKGDFLFFANSKLSKRGNEYPKCPFLKSKGHSKQALVGERGKEWYFRGKLFS